MKTAIAKVMGKVILVSGLFGLVVVASYAKDIDPGITFATYGIDLKIDSRAFYNGLAFPSSTWQLKNLVPTSDHFFNFSDVKPGDSGKTIISMHVKKADAWLCLDFKNLESEENGENDPEYEVDVDGPNSGELEESIEVFAWHDDGDNKFEKKEKPIFKPIVQSAAKALDEKTYSIGDTESGGSCKANDSRYVGIYWCVGKLSVNTNTAVITCNGEHLDNDLQTDSLSLDIAIRAMPAKENPKFICKNTRPHYSRR